VKNTVILVNNYGMGKADESLQQTLFAKYVELVQQNGELPAAFLFYTMGDILEAQMKAEKVITH